MGRWGDGEMGEIFIKGNYPDMISSRTKVKLTVEIGTSEQGAERLLATLHKLIQRCRGATRDGEQSLAITENAPLRSWEGSAVLGRQRGLGGPPHERLPWFPLLALCRGFPHSRFASRSEVYFCPGTYKHHL
ncbi:hypothetical protein BJP36_42455 [Moorena producens JHB]|uniref:Uncharacterized protein n=1 Tax=Moorena producens (strain JHB) TaxID=1454205 RepID=A0A9Q9SSV1_MOOP1|nr:hypothetical protein [Moorena producens]WAN69023.1 hypothetical protein BJP36_42455 [Moorena producens JHB]